MSQQQSKEVHTSIDGNVTVENGNFIGRDQIFHIGPLKLPKFAAFAIIVSILVIVVAVIMMTFFTGGIYRIFISSTPTYTPRPTHTPIPTDTPTPTSTPLAIATSRPDETLILIATFEDSEGSMPHREIYDAIHEGVTQAGIENFRHEIIPNILTRYDHEIAAELGEQYNATMVIWGEDTKVNIVANFLHLKEPDFEVRRARIEKEKGSFLNTYDKPDPYSTFMTQDLPAQFTFLALFAIGHSYYVNADYEDAIRTINRAVILIDENDPPGLADAHYRLGWLYQKSGDNFDRQTSIAHNTEAIRLNGDYFKAYNNRGNDYAELQEYEKAIEDYTQAISIQPDNAALYNNRGNAYTGLQKYEEAIVDYKQAIMIQEDNALFYYNRAILYKAIGELGLASQDVQNTSRLLPVLASEDEELSIKIRDALQDWDEQIQHTLYLPAIMK